MVIFHSYVSLPEGNTNILNFSGDLLKVEKKLFYLLKDYGKKVVLYVQCVYVYIYICIPSGELTVRN